MELPNNAVGRHHSLGRPTYTIIASGFAYGTSVAKHGCAGEHRQHQNSGQRVENERFSVHIYWELLSTPSWPHFPRHAWPV